MANHIAAIHVLKSKLQLADGDYRALLLTLTGKNSAKVLTAAEQFHVRNHMQGLAERMGVVRPTATNRPLSSEQFSRVKKETRPKERKVWALWNQLHRDGAISNPSATALNAWVLRQVDVSALRFATDPQLDTLIEALKAWQERI
jgi:phage gp16-like protein